MILFCFWSWNHIDKGLVSILLVMLSILWIKLEKTNKFLIQSTFFINCSELICFFIFYIFYGSDFIGLLKIKENHHVKSIDRNGNIPTLREFFLLYLAGIVICKPIMVKILMVQDLIFLKNQMKEIKQMSKFLIFFFPIVNNLFNETTACCILFFV